MLKVTINTDEPKTNYYKLHYGHMYLLSMIGHEKRRGVTQNLSLYITSLNKIFNQVVLIVS